MTKLTLQINNLEALERLIGGDSEIEIDIRNSVVQRFAEKHLKPLANGPEMSNTLTAIKSDIRKQISEKCEKEIAIFQTTWNGGVHDIKLRPEIKAEIDRQVRTLTDEYIRKSVEEALEFWANDVELKKRIDNRFEYYTTDHINSEIKNRIEKLKTKL